MKHSKDEMNCVKSISVKQNPMEEIGIGVFSGCYSLLEVDIPSSVNKIEEGAFSQCENLERVKGMDGVKEMGEAVFSCCKDLVEVEIMSPFLSNIPKETFYQCYKLTKVKLVEGLEVIGRDSFEDCKALSEVDVPASVTFVAAGAFEHAKRITSSLDNNLALGIRLRALYESQTEETIPMDKLITVYSQKPITKEDLQGRYNKTEIALLQAIKSEYITRITNLNASSHSGYVIPNDRELETMQAPCSSHTITSNEHSHMATDRHLETEQSSSSRTSSFSDGPDVTNDFKLKAEQAPSSHSGFFHKKWCALCKILAKIRVKRRSSKSTAKAQVIQNKPKPHPTVVPVIKKDDRWWINP